MRTRLIGRNAVFVTVGRVIALLPFNVVRVLMYRLIFRYRIRSSKLGWNTLIVVANASFEECSIGRHNKFIGPMSLRVRKNARVGDHNTFVCGWWTIGEGNGLKNYRRTLQLEEDILITGGHMFDVCGSVVVGRQTWIAGAGSQFWSHGAGATKQDIRLGERCYLGSAVRFAPGSAIGDNSIVAIGSVVTGAFNKRNVLIAGVPAKIVRENYVWFERNGLKAAETARERRGPESEQTADRLPKRRGLTEQID